MEIKLIKDTIVSEIYEKHYNILINGKEVWVSKWGSYNDIFSEGDTEILEGRELLTDEEKEQVIDYVNDL